MKNRILRIAIYFLIAAGVSFTLRVVTPDWYGNFSLPYGFTELKFWLQGFGPLLGAIVVTKVFKMERHTSIFGKHKGIALIALSVPVILLTIIGLDAGNGLNPHYYGFLMGLMIMVYATLEESGWRGYLQDELSDVKPWTRYVITGFLWYLWHFTFLAGEFHLMNEVIVLAILVLSSWGIGKIAEHTGSIALAGCFHALGNILGLSTVFRDNLPSFQKYLIVGICLVVWVPLLMKWESVPRKK